MGTPQHFQGNCDTFSQIRENFLGKMRPWAVETWFYLPFSLLQRGLLQRQGVSVSLGQLLFEHLGN